MSNRILVTENPASWDLELPGVESVGISNVLPISGGNAGRAAELLFAGFGEP